MTSPRCRLCDTELVYTFVDLGMSPLSNSFLSVEQLGQKEAVYPLHVRVCHKCFLAQVEEFEPPEHIFSGYAYLSSYSESWLAHARQYVEEMMQKLALGTSSRVVEIASNDGYLLQYFVQRSVPVLGIEPAANVAAIAQAKGVPTRAAFFSAQAALALVQEGIRADLLLGNNVLAHVPDLNGFVEGLRILLQPRGTITMEFPHLMRLIAENQFDTIYHEHFSYFSLHTVEKVFAAHGLAIVDVEELPTHGGSLRIYATHAGAATGVSDRIIDLRRREQVVGMLEVGTYTAFAKKVEETRRALIEFLAGVRRQGLSVAGYGAPAKGNTLLNYCRIGPETVQFTVDKNPQKQGRFLPGSHIPIYAPEKLREARPDYVLILPWNLRDEIMGQIADVRNWGGKFLVPIPRVEVLA